MNIEQVVSTAVSDLALGSVFTFDDLYGVVQQRRGRRLRIVELAEIGDHDGLCAVWLTTDEDDIIIHARTDSALHRQ